MYNFPHPKNKIIEIINDTNINILNGYVGLLNQRNTCYLNSILQTLFMTLDFRYNILLNQSLIFDISLENSNIDYQLKKLFINLYFRTSNQLKTDALTSTFSWGYKLLHDQQDIQEFCRVFLDALSLNNKDLNQLFEGYIRSTISCPLCKNRSICDNSFMDIQLPINRNENDNKISDLIRKYQEIDYLTGDNKYYCSICDKYTENCEKIYTFTLLPQIMVFQLTRLIFDRKTQIKVKLCNSIYLDDIISINDCVYKLYSIICHKGDSISGHYFSYIFSFETGKWFIFNDDTVEEANILEEIETILQNAYLIFYQKIDSKEQNELKLLEKSLSFSFSSECGENSYVLRISNIPNISELSLLSNLNNTLIVNFKYENIIKNIKINKNQLINNFLEQLVKEFNIILPIKKTRNSSINTINYKDYIKISKQSKYNYEIFDELILDSNILYINNYIDYFYSYSLFSINISLNISKNKKILSTNKIIFVLLDLNSNIKSIEDISLSSFKTQEVEKDQDFYNFFASSLIYRVYINDNKVYYAQLLNNEKIEYYSYLLVTNNIITTKNIKIKEIPYNKYSNENITNSMIDIISSKEANNLNFYNLLSPEDNYKFYLSFSNSFNISMPFLVSLKCCNLDELISKINSILRMKRSKLYYMEFDNNSINNFQIKEIVNTLDLNIFFQTNSQRIYCHLFDSEISFINNDIQSTFYLKFIKKKITSFSKILISCDDQINNIQVSSSLIFKNKEKFIKLLHDTYFLKDSSSIYFICDLRDAKFEYELEDFLALYAKYPQIDDINKNFSNDENNESTSTSSNQQEMLLIK